MCLFWFNSIVFTFIEVVIYKRQWRERFTRVHYILLHMMTMVELLHRESRESVTRHTPFYCRCAIYSIQGRDVKGDKPEPFILSGLLF